MDTLEELEKARNSLTKAIKTQRQRIYRRKEKIRNHNIFLSFGLLNYQNKLFSKEELETFLDDEIKKRCSLYEIRLKDKYL